VKTPDYSAPTWRWKIYNNWQGYSNPGKFIRAMWTDAYIGFFIGWSKLWQWMLPILFVYFLFK
jgi:hypothetical protein